ncbi:hypothetical protein [Hazenella coriacea]|uniref:Uncharacterized protein n=1 Tax=Hazenella coriacea TaxID=1179467 RepID=A0A4R3LAP5_9BACL|nr:hypothetical protein [Hazenella coriacea]TCS96782.1 hypothetical protein EDD58_101423 [Hazenella coriacea]
MNQHSPDWEEIEALEDELQDSLSQYLVKQPSSTDTAQLISQLQVHFDPLREKSMKSQPVFSRPRPSLLQLCRFQLNLFQPWFWVVSLIFLAMTIMIGLFWNGSPRPEVNLLYSSLIPLFYLGALLAHERIGNQGMRMIESITPFPPMLIVLSRIFILLLLTLVFGLFTMGNLVLWGSTLSIGGFLLSWLSIVLFMTGFLAMMLFYKGVRTALLSTTLSIIIVFMIEQWLMNSVMIQEWLVFFQWGLLVVGVILIGISYRQSKKIYHMHLR